jgi:2-polyprenyl-6-methoxyphenol hydroxylase-like FAD-dependent oxidoreductase
LPQPLSSSFIPTQSTNNHFLMNTLLKELSIKMISTTSQPVIVVGASLVGLSAALCLASHQVPTIVLEKHSGKSQHPRAIGFTSRTMEIYRALGIENIEPAPEDFKLERAHVESLTGKWLDESSWSDTERKPKAEKPVEKPPRPSGPKKEYSVERASAIPQDKLEPMLEALALERGADIRRQQKLIRVDQDQDGVIATVTDAEGHEQKIRGSYLIAADGNRSTVRQLLQIPRNGRGHMQTLSSVLFRAPIEQWTKGFVQFDISQPDLKAFLASYSDGRWALMFKDAIDRDEQALRAAIYQAVGRSDFPVEVITTGRWELTALVADTFQAGRIFLAGDAAHTLPPNRGGYGANTGIHDVHNLAWKLAAVLSGKSSPELLDTYNAERRPVALLRHDQIFVRADYKIHLDTATPAGQKIDDDAMEFGQIYLSQGIIGADESLPRANKPDEWNGQPGTHMPHFWVLKDGKKVPTLDLINQGAWTLISESDEWSEAVSTVNESSSVPLEFIRIGECVQLVHEDDFQKSFAISQSGAALIRPDGYIAWRVDTIPSDAAEALKGVMSKVSFSTGRSQV